MYSIDPNNPEETIKKLPTREMGPVKNIYKALYPSNRWRDAHDYNEVVLNKPMECFVAPDEKTIYFGYLILSIERELGLGLLMIKKKRRRISLLLSVKPCFFLIKN